MTGERERYSPEW